jgi:hypothetical protein
MVPTLLIRRTRHIYPAVLPAASIDDENAALPIFRCVGTKCRVRRASPYSFLGFIPQSSHHPGLGMRFACNNWRRLQILIVADRGCLVDGTIITTCTLASRLGIQTERDRHSSGVYAFPSTRTAKSIAPSLVPYRDLLFLRLSIANAAFSNTRHTFASIYLCLVMTMVLSR